MKIPVVVVDDNEMDRYIVRRRLAEAGDFAELREVCAGDQFLNEYFGPAESEDLKGEKLLVLMDINMPRMDGFETVQSMQEMLARGLGPKSCVVLMFTSSENPMDQKQAEQLPLVQGYVVKPLDRPGVDFIREIYNQAEPQLAIGA